MNLFQRLAFWASNALLSLARVPTTPPPSPPSSPTYDAAAIEEGYRLLGLTFDLHDKLLTRAKAYHLLADTIREEMQPLEIQLAAMHSNLADQLEEARASEQLAARCQPQQPKGISE